MQKIFKKILPYLVLALSVLFISDICMADNIPVFKDPNKAIVLKSSQAKFNIELPSNPSTGYSWLLSKYNPELIKAIKQQYHASQNQLMGQAGMSEWTFEADEDAFKVPHQLKITFVYVRPWEATKPANTETFTIVTQ